MYLCTLLHLCYSLLGLKKRPFHEHKFLTEKYYKDFFSGSKLTEGRILVTLASKTCVDSPKEVMVTCGGLAHVQMKFERPKAAEILFQP